MKRQQQQHHHDVVDPVPVAVEAAAVIEEVSPFSFSSSSSSTQSTVVPSSNASFGTLKQSSSAVMQNNVSVDDILATKLNQMSLEERTIGLHDLHGVAEKPKWEETPTFIQTKLEEMSQILNNNDDDADMPGIVDSQPSATSTATTIMTMTTTTTPYDNAAAADDGDDDDLEDDDDDHASSSESSSVVTASTETTTDTTTTKDDVPISKDAYNMALSINREYVNEIKTLCLRAENYNPNEAASLTMRFFHRKLYLFGPNHLCRDIQQSDLLEDDDTAGDGAEAINALRQGLMQLLPYRDRSGRAILFIDGKVNEVCKSTKTVCRVIFYMSMVALQDSETQRAGIVLIYYAIGQTHHIAGRTIELWENWKSTPWNIVALHYCLEANQKAKGVMTPSLFTLFHNFQSRNSSRFRFHTGSNVECIYNLLTFGIPKDALPVREDGSRDMVAHNAMLQMLQRREKERSSSPSTSAAHAHTDLRHQNQQQKQHEFDEIAQSDLLELDDILDDDEIDQVEHYNRDGSSTVSSSASSSPLSPSTMKQSTPVVAQIKTTPTPRGKPESSKSMEQSNNKLILVPNPTDILMGKGRLPKSHPGNLRMRCLIVEYFEQYNTSHKRDKPAITDSIFQKLKDSGCRFLRHDNDQGGYSEASDVTAREKISHGFRNLRIDKSKKNAARAAANKNKQKTKNSRIDDESSNTHSHNGIDGTAKGSGNSKKKRKNCPALPFLES